MKKLLALLLLIPVFTFGQVNQNNSVFGGSVAGPGGGGGTGPYSPTSFTLNALLTGGGTGAINAIGVSGTGNALTALNSITAAASTDLTLNAGSGTQNINLNVTGTTGAVNISGIVTGANPWLLNQLLVGGCKGGDICVPHPLTVRVFRLAQNWQSP